MPGRAGGGKRVWHSPVGRLPRRGADGCFLGWEVGGGAPMYSWIYLLVVLLTPFGLAVLAVGVILWLCERSWGQRVGDLGSVGLLAVGGLLSLPVALVLLAVAYDHFAH
jgi:hypothetical protein